MFIVEIVDPITSTVDVGKAVAEQGILNVLAGLMIVSFIIMGSFLLKTGYKALNDLAKALKGLNDSSEKLLTQNQESIQYLSVLVSRDNKELLITQTKYNTERILKMSFADSVNALMTGVIEIIAQNHISDKEYTYNRVKSVVYSIHFDRVKELNEMMYNNQRIGDFIDRDDWVKQMIEIIVKFIYSEPKDKLNKDILFRDLKIAHKQFMTELKL